MELRDNGECYCSGFSPGLIRLAQRQLLLAAMLAIRPSWMVLRRSRAPRRRGGTGLPIHRRLETTGTREDHAPTRIKPPCRIRISTGGWGYMQRTIWHLRRRRARGYAIVASVALLAAGLAVFTPGVANAQSGYEQIILAHDTGWGMYAADGVVQNSPIAVHASWGTWVGNNAG